MNDKKAHDKLKDINRQRNKIGVGGYRDSRREKCERHEKFNETMQEISKEHDEQRMKDVEDE